VTLIHNKIFKKQQQKNDSQAKHFNKKLFFYKKKCPVAMLRVRKQEDNVGVRRLVWLYSITQNHKTKVVLLAHFTKAQLSTITQFPGFLNFSEQSVCTSLCPVSLSDFHDRQFLFYLVY